MLRTRRLCRYFGDDVALTDVNLTLHAGRVTALLGPNGAGKTTLLRILIGLMAPSSGTIETPGQAPRGRRRGAAVMSYVPSGDRTFYERLSGQENLRFAARMEGLRRSEARSRSAQLLDQVGLSDAAHRRVGTYSHGMQKRLALARGLLLEPAIMLVDEATHDLDPGGAAQIRQLISGIAAHGTAVLWTTQHLEELPGFADEAVVLADGRVRHRGTIDDLLTHAPRRRYVLTLAERDTYVDLQAVIAGSADLTVLSTSPPRVLLALADRAVLGNAITALTAAGATVVSCREERSELRDAFLRLVEHADR